MSSFCEEGGRRLRGLSSTLVPMKRSGSEQPQCAGAGGAWDGGGKRARLEAPPAWQLRAPTTPINAVPASAAAIVAAAGANFATAGPPSASARAQSTATATLVAASGLAFSQAPVAAHQAAQRGGQHRRTSSF